MSNGHHQYVLLQIVKGSDPIEIRTPPVVQVSLDLAVTIDDFFNLGELINNLAFVLRIDPSTIRVVNIIAEDEQLGRRRRNLLAVSNHTTITLEFGEPPALNVSTPETPTVAEEVAMSGEANNSVDTGVWTHIHTYIHTNTHTYEHTYIHTYIHISFPGQHLYRNLIRCSQPPQY